MACEVMNRNVIQHIGVAVVKSVNDVPIEEDFKYLLDNDRSYIRAFCSVDDAKNFMRGYYGDERVEVLRYPYVTVCPHCDTGMLVDADDVSKNDSETCYTCPKCGKAFDIAGETTGEQK